MAELTRDTMRAIAEQKLALYRNTIYDQSIELRVMERVKDLEEVKRLKMKLVRFERIVDELNTVLKELGDTTEAPDGKNQGCGA